MQRHVFDGVNRVSQKTVEAQRVMRWLPPAMDKGGKLIHAEPREDSQLRQAVAMSGGVAAATAAPAEAARFSTSDSGGSWDDAFEQGLLAGRQEGLQKGLAEGRAQGEKLGHEQGYAEGMTKGQADGYQAGLQKASHEVRQQLNTLNSIMTHLTHALNEQDYELEKALLGIVREVARQVIQRELHIDSRHVMQIVQQALNTLPPTRDNVRILVNPADKDLVMRAAEAGGENWRVIAHPQVERGGCRVETDHSAVDFTVTERFNQAIQQIVDKQFLEEDDPRQQGIPPGESRQPAPEPIVKPAVAASKKRLSLAEQAQALAAGELPELDDETDPASVRPEAL